MGEVVNLSDLSKGLAALGIKKQRPSSYLGSVATRGSFIGQPNTGLRQAMTETWHVIRCTGGVTFLRGVWSGWRIGNGLEVAVGAATTITASVVDSAGVPHQFTFSGAVQGLIPDGGMLVSDPVAIVAANCSKVLMRSYITNPVGIPYTTAGATPADKMEFGASGITDKTMTGGVSSAQNTLGFFPTAILSNTIDATAFLAGDSIELAINETANDASGEIGILARSIGPQMAYIHGGIPGAQMALDNTGSNYTNRLALSAYCSHIIRQHGINEIASTAATMASRATTFAAKFSGKPVYGCTLAPSVTGTLSTVAGQTVTANEANRTGFNDLVRAGISGEVGYFDIADALETDRNSGKWAVSYLDGVTSGVAFTADGIHPLNAGSERVRRRGVVNPNYLRR